MNHEIINETDVVWRLMSGTTSEHWLRPAVSNHRTSVSACRGSAVVSSFQD